MCFCTFDIWIFSTTVHILDKLFYIFFNSSLRQSTIMNFFSTMCSGDNLHIIIITKYSYINIFKQRGVSTYKE